MAHHNVYTFFSVHNCLDEDFDAPDEGDSELCRAIVAGRMGLHPDGWGNHDPLSLRWLMRRRRERDLPGFGQPLPLDEPEWKPAKPAAKPRPKPAPRSAWYPPRSEPAVGPSGHVQLTCDDCEARFRVTLYYPGGQRPAVVQSIRLLGRDEGWTCIAGTDRCPACSQPAAPEAVSNGAGGNQGDEQHA